MFNPTFDDAVDAATVLFNLPEYRVVAVHRDALGAREVFIDTPATEAACPGLRGAVLAGASTDSPAGSRRPVRWAGDGVVGEEAMALR